MNIEAPLSLVVGLCIATSAVAEPCVTTTFDRPVTGATSVVTHQVDVPSTRFPGLWQEGLIGGYFYEIFANGEALLRSSRKEPNWQIDIVCPGNNETCVTMQTGAPPDDSMPIGDLLRQCLQDSNVTKVATTEDYTTPPETSAGTVPCGVATLPQEAEGFTLQRLVLMAGGNPGPIDGLPGELTFEAVVEVLNDGTENLPIANIIDALDAMVCSQGQ